MEKENKKKVNVRSVRVDKCREVEKKRGIGKVVVGEDVDDCKWMKVGKQETSGRERRWKRKYALIWRAQTWTKRNRISNFWEGVDGYRLEEGWREETDGLREDVC